MRRTLAWSVQTGGTALLLLLHGAAGIMAQPPERVEYWRTHYQELQPTADPRAAKAHDIFKRLVQVAGKRPGVLPRLLIITRDPWEFVLPIALPDGGIILSKSALDLCYQQDPSQGDDRLAFVLAHELAHLLNDDLWHWRFFQARADLSVLQSATDPEQGVAKELRADERGILYAAMAGFQPHAIVTERPDVDFFTDWVRALKAMGRLAGPSDVRPTPQERAADLRVHLRRVADTTGLFHLGLWSYYAGNYPRAVQAFEAFQATFPGREVYQNLAVSHHQLAWQAYQQLSSTGPAFPWHLSLAIEPVTRASAIYLVRTRGQGTDPAGAFHDHLREAIRWYEEALLQEPDYLPAALNLGAALLLRGVHNTARGLSSPDFNMAVGKLSQAEQQTPASPELLNNLGVALWYQERPQPAKDTLTKAQAHAPTFAAPVCNLEAIARAEHHNALAQQYQERCAQLSGRAMLPSAPPLPETVSGMPLGAVQSKLRGNVAPLMHSTVTLHGTPLTLATHPMGVMSLAWDGEIIMVMVREGYQGQSAQGLHIGNRDAEVLARYGPPSRRHELTQGQNWAYDPQRIAYQFRAGRIVSWLLY